MTRLLLDTSVLVKWFHSEGESEMAPSLALRAAHATGELDAHILDLGVYELGNVLVRGLRWPAADVADQLDDLHTILGPPLVMAPAWLRRAASLADEHSLAFYDASWAGAAAELGVPLVSADRQLLAAGIAESPSEIVSRLGLPLGRARRGDPPRSR